MLAHQRKTDGDCCAEQAKTSFGRSLASEIEIDQHHLKVSGFRSFKTGLVPCL